jgi:adenosine deaminase
MQALWESGVALTLNTDNPGISRTGLTCEFLVAADMWGAMSLWDCLAFIKQGFVHAMATVEVREHLLKRIDLEIYTCITDWIASRACQSANSMP